MDLQTDVAAVLAVKWAAADRAALRPGWEVHPVADLPNTVLVTYWPSEGNAIEALHWLAHYRPALAHRTDWDVRRVENAVLPALSVTARPDPLYLDQPPDRVLVDPRSVAYAPKVTWGGPEGCLYHPARR